VMSDEEALTANARCPYALGASVFSKHATSARALAGRIRAGSVIINDLIAPTADPRVPFGGVGQSGFGVTRGAEGLLEMTFPKVIALNGSSRRWHYQHLGESDAPLMTALLELTHAPSLGQKFRALHRVIRFARGRKSGTDQAPEIQRDQTFPTT
jgi:delta 1-pyrroline-5-carboxylate dehydrogenase